MICYCWQLIDYLLEDPSEGALYSYTTEGPKSYQLEFLSPSGFGYLSPPLGTEEEMLEVRKSNAARPAPAAATPSVPKRPRNGGGSGEAGSSSQQATGEDDGTKKDRKKKPRKQQQQ